MKGSRLSVLAVAALVVAASLAATSSAPAVESQSLRGGTYRVGWPTAFLDRRPARVLGRPRPHRRGQHRLGRDPLEPAPAHARRLQPRRRRRRRSSSCRISPFACRLRRTAAGRTRSRSSAASASGRRSTARSRSSDIRYAIERLARKRSRSEWAPVFGDIKGFAAYRSGRGPVDLRHLDAQREDDRVHSHAAERATSSTGSPCPRPRRSHPRSASASRAVGSSTDHT